MVWTGGIGRCRPSPERSGPIRLLAQHPRTRGDPHPAGFGYSPPPVYQALLTRKYLTSKIMPLLAMVAVMLSVATVLITWSVMGGFLKVLLESGRPMMGDAMVHWPNAGFAHYDDLIARLEADPRIEAASPMIESFGMVQLPSAVVRAVQVKGVDPESFRRVTGFESTLWWKPLDRPTRKDKDHEDPRLSDHESWKAYEEQGRTFTRTDEETGRTEPAANIGIEMTGFNQRLASGVYVPWRPVRPTVDGGVEAPSVFMPREGTIGLTVLALSPEGVPIDAVSRRIAVANEFQSGVYEVDEQTVLVPIDWLQHYLRMDEAKRIEPADPYAVVTRPDGTLGPAADTVIGIAPARVTSVLIRAAPGIPPDEIKRLVKEEIYPAFDAAHDDVPPAATIFVRTWEDINATLIASVRKETGLVLFIFGIVCFTTVFLVLAIFWSMVSEKTKDIGILRALGASTPGVAWLWLRYGAAIGFVGAAMGTLAGYLIVTNINTIHEWLGETFGLLIWDPRVYYFTEIPREVEPVKALVVFTAGVLTCLVGAAWPAWRAANMRPVQALRFE